MVSRLENIYPSSCNVFFGFGGQIIKRTRRNSARPQTPSVFLFGCLISETKGEKKATKLKLLSLKAFLLRDNGSKIKKGQSASAACV